MSSAPMVLFLGLQTKCNMMTRALMTTAKRTCNYLCDVTNAATMEIRILSDTPAANQPSICDVKVT